MLLSRHGSGRASAYVEVNKIATFQYKTHVAWLDSVADKFCVRIRTLNRRSNRWSQTYYPHHYPFRYRKSKCSNEASEWEEEIQFGEELTYPPLVCGPDDTLYLMTASRGQKNQPWSVEQ